MDSMLTETQYYGGNNPGGGGKFMLGRTGIWIIDHRRIHEKLASGRDPCRWSDIPWQTTSKETINLVLNIP